MQRPGEIRAREQAAAAGVAVMEDSEEPSDSSGPLTKRLRLLLPPPLSTVPATAPTSLCASDYVTQVAASSMRVPAQTSLCATEQLEPHSVIQVPTNTSPCASRQPEPHCSIQVPDPISLCADEELEPYSDIRVPASASPCAPRQPEPPVSKPTSLFAAEPSEPHSPIPKPAHTSPCTSEAEPQTAINLPVDICRVSDQSKPQTPQHQHNSASEVPVQTDNRMPNSTIGVPTDTSAALPIPDTSEKHGSPCEIGDIGLREQCDRVLAEMVLIENWDSAMQFSLEIVQRALDGAFSEELQVFVVSEHWPSVLEIVMSRASLSVSSPSDSVILFLERSITFSMEFLRNGFKEAIVVLNCLLDANKHVYADSSVFDTPSDSLSLSHDMLEYFSSFDSVYAALPELEYGSISPVYIRILSLFLANEGFRLLIDGVATFSSWGIINTSGILMQIGEFAVPKYIESVLQSVFDVVSPRLLLVEGEKQLTRVASQLLLKSLAKLCWRVLSPEEFKTRLGTLRLQVALNSLSSTQLDKQVAGLNDIVETVRLTMLTEREEMLKSSEGSNNSSQGSEGEITRFDPIPSSQLLPWLCDNQVLELVLAAENHIQIVSRSEVLINYLAMHKKLPIKPIEMLWEHSLHKHESVVSSVYNTVRNVCVQLPRELQAHLLLLFSKIDLESYNDELTMLLSEVSLCCLKSHQDRVQALADLAVKLDTKLSQGNKGADSINDLEAEHFGVFRLWKLSLSGSSLALERCHWLLSLACGAPLRPLYTRICVGLLQSGQHTSVAFTTLSRLMDHATPDEIGKLQSQFDLLRLVFNGLHQVLSTSTPAEVQRRLDFLARILAVPSIQLSCENVSLLWSCMVMGMVPEWQRDAGFMLLCKAGHSAYSTDSARFLLLEEFPKLDLETLSLPGLQCLVHLFLLLNTSSKAVLCNASLLVYSGTLLGLSLLWDVAVGSLTPAVSSAATSFLVQVLSSPAPSFEGGQAHLASLFRRAAFEHLSCAFEKRDHIRIQHCLTLIERFLEATEAIFSTNSHLFSTCVDVNLTSNCVPGSSSSCIPCSSSAALSNDEGTFALFLRLLEIEGAVSTRVWRLLLHLPVNGSLERSLRLLSSLDEGEGTPTSEGWLTLLPLGASYTLAYRLEVLRLISCSKVGVQWTQRFVRLRGFQHLVRVLLSFDAERLCYEPSCHKCLCLLLPFMYAFSYGELQKNRSWLFALQPSLKSPVLNLGTENVLQSVDIGALMTQLAVLSTSISTNDTTIINTTTDAATLDLLLQLLVLLAVAHPEILNNLLASSDPPSSAWSRLVLSTMLSTNLTLHRVATAAIIICCLKTSHLMLTTPSKTQQTLLSYTLSLLEVEMDRVMKPDVNCLDFVQLFCCLLIQEFSLSNTTSFWTPRLRTLFHFGFESLQTLSGASGQLLASLLTLLRTLLALSVELRTDPLLTSGRDGCQGLIPHVLEHCLFAHTTYDASAPSLRLHNAPAQVQCRSPHNRQLAYLMLLEGSRGVLNSWECVRGSLSGLLQSYDGGPTKMNVSLLPQAESGFVGLENLSATCYMNAILQQLFMNHRVRRSLLCARIAEESSHTPETAILEETQRLLLHLQESDTKFYTPNRFCASMLDAHHRPVDRHEQMDANEFLNVLFDRIDEALKGSRHCNLMKSQFGGSFCHQIICEICSSRSEREEPFYTASLTMKNKKTLQDCLSLFVEGEQLAGDNAYLCSHCNAKQPALKRSVFQALPRSLVLHLNRFEFEFDTMSKRKLNDRVEFPNRLDMAPFLNTDQQHERPSSLYSLRGIVVHAGTADSGHYYSYIRETASDRWFEFNDVDVSSFDPVDIASNCFGGAAQLSPHPTMRAEGSQPVQQVLKRHSAYMLFYERLETEAVTASAEVASSMQLERPIGQEEFRREVFATNSYLSLTRSLIDPTFAAFIQSFCNNHPPLQDLSAEQSQSVRVGRFELLMEYMLKVLPRSPSSSWKDWSHFALDCLKGDIDVARAFCRRYILPDQALRGLLANASEHGELIVLSVGELLSVDGHAAGSLSFLCVEALLSVLPSLMSDAYLQVLKGVARLGAAIRSHLLDRDFLDDVVLLLSSLDEQAIAQLLEILAILVCSTATSTSCTPPTASAGEQLFHREHKLRPLFKHAILKLFLHANVNLPSLVKLTCHWCWESLERSQHVLTVILACIDDFNVEQLPACFVLFSSVLEMSDIFTSERVLFSMPRFFLVLRNNLQYKKATIVSLRFLKKLNKKSATVSMWMNSHRSSWQFIEQLDCP